MHDCLFLLSLVVLTTQVLGGMQLHNAVIANNMYVVQDHIQQRTDLNAVDANNRTPLMWAVDLHHTAIVKILIAARAELNIQDSWGNTALMIAINKEHTTLVKLLLQAGARVDQQNRDGRTALMIAAYNGTKDLVELLIGVADLNQEGRLHKNALYVAFFGSPHSLPVIKFLLRQGAQLPKRASRGVTALSYYNMKDRNSTDFFVIAYLIPQLHRRGQLNVLTQHIGLSRLHPRSHTHQLIYMLNQRELTYFLSDPVSYARTMPEPTDLGQTPLMWALIGGYQDALQVMLTHPELTPTYMNIQDCYGRNALMYAVLVDDLASVKLLLAYPEVKKSIHARSNGGYTALDYAAMYGYTQVLLCLLENGSTITPYTIARTGHNGQHLLAAQLLIAKCYPGIKLML